MGPTVRLCLLWAGDGEGLQRPRLKVPKASRAVPGAAWLLELLISASEELPAFHDLIGPSDICITYI